MSSGRFFCAAWIVAAAALLVAVCFLGFATEHLLLGWIYFPLRVLPQVTVDWPSALVGLAGLIGFVVVLHVTMRWLMRAKTGGDTESRYWSWRSTAALAVTILLLFAAGVAMVGVTHQGVWLASGRSNAANAVPPIGISEAARQAGDQYAESNNLKMIGLGFGNFEDQYLAFPAGGTMTEDGELLHGWAGLALPYLNYSAEGMDYAAPWNKPPNDRLYKCNLVDFTNPALAGPYFDAEGFGLSHVAGNIQVLPIRKVHFDLADPKQSRGRYVLPKSEQGHVQELTSSKRLSGGGSQTILIGTVTQNFKPWGHPANLRDPARGIDRSPDGFGGPPAWRGAQFVMCDGSVRFVSNKVDRRDLRALATPSNGEEAPDSGVPEKR